MASSAGAGAVLGPAGALIAGVRRGLGARRGPVAVGGHPVHWWPGPDECAGPGPGLDGGLGGEEAERVAGGGLRDTAVCRHELAKGGNLAAWFPLAFGDAAPQVGGDAQVLRLCHRDRSEERRVGKECRSRWSPY